VRNANPLEVAPADALLQLAGDARDLAALTCLLLNPIRGDGEHKQQPSASNHNFERWGFSKGIRGWPVAPFGGSGRPVRYYFEGR